MKRLAIIMSAAIVMTSTFSFGKVNTVNEKKVPNSLRSPIFQKLDSEVVKAAREKGVKIEAEATKNFAGKSYLRPAANTEVLANKDMTGKDHKGIAILVDFPGDEGSKSNVPGVNYPRVPSGKFNDLLNGTAYNPYDLDVFKNLATYEQKDKNGKVIKTYEAPTDRTLKNYYNEVSYDNFGIDVKVVDWVTLPKDYEYYLGQNNGYVNENGSTNIGELVADAIKEADKTVDFSQYAVTPGEGEIWNYEDGTPVTLENGKPVEKIVPNIFIIHRGTGAEFSQDPSVIWSHKWDIMSANYFGSKDKTGEFMNEKDLKYMAVDGVAVNTYDICPEVGKDITGYLKTSYPDVYGPDYKGSAPCPAYPGVYAHEFGHVLGLPDQYDYGYDSEGTGMYTLMAGGSYGRNIPSGFYSGNTPVNMDAWSKMYLGFATPKIVNKNQSLTLRPSSQAPDIFKIDVPGSNGREYFLLENRQQKGFDQGLSYSVDGNTLHGLAVYHVVNDILVRNFDRPNEAANWDTNHTGKSSVKQFTVKNGEYHYGISLMQADGNYDMEKGINDADSGDLFPGKNKVTSISSKGNAKVNTTSLYKWSTKSTETGIVIQNIKENADGTVTCNVVFTK